MYNPYTQQGHDEATEQREDLRSRDVVTCDTCGHRVPADEGGRTTSGSFQCYKCDEIAADFAESAEVPA